MKIEHHLSDSILRSYAAGTLPEAFCLVVATHISMCDDCRAALLAYEALGGALLDGEDARMNEGALETCMARLPQPDHAPARSIPRHRAGLFPAPLSDYAGSGPDAVRWRPLGNGIRRAILRTGPGGASARLLRIPAGCAVPDHGHGGLELTLVLQGAFRDDTARFGPGDVEIASLETDHRPVAEPGEDCICLAATDAPLRFNHWIPRLLQPIFQI